jgi:hypothetical protein
MTTFKRAELVTNLGHVGDRTRRQNEEKGSNKEKDTRLKKTILLN